MRRLVCGLALALLASACRETLAVPSACAVECTTGLQIRDTVLDAIPGGDSSYVGYVGGNEAPSLLVSNGAEAGVSHAIVGFDATPDSIEASGTNFGYTIDSLVIVVGLVARDTLVSGGRFLIYRLPVETDTTASLAQVESYFTPERLIDSLAIPDSVQAGNLRLVLRGDSLLRAVIPPEDSGRVTLGITLHAEVPTAVRIGSRLTGNLKPGFITFATGDEGIPEPRARMYDPEALTSWFVRSAVPATDSDLLMVGGLPASRAIVRFAMPEQLRRQASFLRATLVLVPDQPMTGVPHDRTSLDVRAVVADLGYRSPPTGVGGASVVLPLTAADPVEIEVQGIVNLWKQSERVAQLFYLSIGPEGASWDLPAFRSSRSPTGRPRLRLTYVLPGRPEAF